MAIFNTQVPYSKEQLLSLYPKPRSIITEALIYLYAIFRFSFIIVQNLYCIPSYLVLSWIVLLPIKWLKSDLYSRLENYLYNSLIFIVSIWSLAAEAQIVEAGDEYKHLIEDPETHFPENSLKRKKESKSRRSNVEHRQHLYEGTNLANGFRSSKTTGLQNSDHAYLRYKPNELATVNSDKNEDLQESIQRANNKTFKLKSMNCSPIIDDSCDMINENDCERIEYGIQIASAAGEKKLIHRTYKTNFRAANNNHLQTNPRSNGNIVKNQQYPLISSNIMSQTVSGEKLENRETLDDQQYRSPSYLKKVSPLSANLSTSIESLKNLQAKPRILFLCNHISTADVPLIMQSFSTLTNQSLLWVLDAQFKMTNFGICCSSHGDFFVAKNSFVDGSLREHVLKQPDRNLLVLFPEGGFLRKRIDGSNRYATKNGFPLTKYVTHPRFGAFRDLIDPSVGVTHIVDATLMYNDIENPLSILDIVFGTRRQPAILHYKLYKRSEINPTEEWLRNIWLEKDKLLEKYYQDRSSLLKQIGTTLRTAHLDWFKILSVHLFYLLVCYLAIFRLFNATSITMLKAREFYYSNM